MPRYARRRRRRLGRRRGRRRLGRRRPRNRLSLARAPIPPRFAAKLKYVFDQNYIDPPGSTAASSHMFRANSLYDPDFTSGGHQPRGFDQFMAMYQTFTVIGSRIKVTARSPDGDSIVGIALKTDSAYPAAPMINSYLEGGNVVYRMTEAIDNGGKPTTLSYGFSPKKFMAISKPMSEDDLRGTASADPAKVAYFHVFSGAVNTTINPQPVYLICEIEYLTIFTDPIQPGQS